MRTLHRSSSAQDRHGEGQCDSYEQWYLEISGLTKKDELLRILKSTTVIGLIENEMAPAKVNSADGSFLDGVRPVVAG